MDQLEGSDRAVSWGWHRVLGLGVGGDAAASGVPASKKGSSLMGLSTDSRKALIDA